MWAVINWHSIKMTEGDYGIQLPIVISGATLTANDEIKLVIKSSINGTAIVEKTFTNISNNTVNLMLTEAESALLPVGSYVYLLDWYQDGAFLCNIIPWATFKVVEKA